MRHLSYLKRASRRFLEGTRCRTPVDAVTSGRRSLEEWAHILAEERDLALQGQLGRRPKHRRSRSGRAAPL